jgi:hypothetical protein
MIRNLFAGCTLLVLFGCADVPIQDIHKGLSRSQVITFMGNPDSSQRSGEYVAFQYANRPINNSPADRADYYVILLEGFVIDYGYGYVRQGDTTVTNKLILVPLQNDAK